MKIILGIIAFTLTFGFSAGLVGLLFGFPQPEVKPFAYNKKYNSVHSDKIQRLLTKDIGNGDLRNQEIYKLETNNNGFASSIYKAKYRSVINDYYVKSSSINDSNLPEDFKYAWREHMNAWKKQAQYLDSLQEDKEGFAEDIDLAVKNYSDNTNEINSTWYQVLRIADRYGVDVDRSYYR